MIKLAETCYVNNLQKIFNIYLKKTYDFKILVRTKYNSMEKHIHIFISFNATSFFVIILFYTLILTYYCICNVKAS